MKKQIAIRITIYLLLTAYVILAGWIIVVYPCQVLGWRSNQCIRAVGYERIDEKLHAKYQASDIQYGTFSFTPYNGYQLNNALRIVFAPFVILAVPNEE